MSEDLISKEKAYEVLTEYYHHRTEMQHKALREALDRVPPVELQPTCNLDKISQFIDGIEEMFADIHERFIDDSVCGLCEYDGAYVGESGDWCNECPGFEKDDCFKLSDKIRKKWTEEIIKALDMVPSADIDLSDYSDRLWRNAYEQGKAVSKDALDEAYAHGYTAAEADFHKKNQWIPVTERLPDDDSACFVTVKYRDIRYTDIAHCFASKDSSVRDWVGANDDDVLAWMPLPEPWEGGAE